jgi:hypothetical protein
LQERPAAATRLLLAKTLDAAAETKTAVECIQKVADDEVSLPHLQFVTEIPEFIDGLSATCQVGGATMGPSGRHRNRRRVVR